MKGFDATLVIHESDVAATSEYQLKNDEKRSDEK